MPATANSPEPLGETPRSRPPVSADVARLAGVSQKTVSRVMNDEPHVKGAVRERVRRAAEQLGYRPNRAARTLTSGRSHRIGVVSLGSPLFGPASVLFAVERAARRRGYALSVVNTPGADPGGIRGAVETLLREGVDGVVLSEPVDEGPLGLSVEVPVLVMGRLPGLSSPHVICTDVAAHEPAQAATRHLLSLGHRTVHHLAGPQRWFSARDRLRGWRAALAEARAEEVEPLEGDWSAASGYEQGRLLARDRDVTAVFAANDEMAIGLVRALAQAGRRVPLDVSVVGYDDIPPAAYLNPPLTTVDQAFRLSAEEGLSALVEAVEHPGRAPRRFERPAARLVLRESTGPPPAAGRTAADARGGPPRTAAPNSAPAGHGSVRGRHADGPRRSTWRIRLSRGAGRAPAGPLRRWSGGPEPGPAASTAP